MNQAIETHKEKIMQEMKELKNEILKEYLAVAKQWDEAVKVLYVSGMDEQRMICLPEKQTEETDYFETMDKNEVYRLHKELVSMKNEESAIKNRVFDRYYRRAYLDEYIAEMYELYDMYGNLEMAEIGLR